MLYRGKILEVYKDGNIGNIKGVIRRLNTYFDLTCTKYLGTDIPSWGSVVFSTNR